VQARVAKRLHDAANYLITSTNLCAAKDEDIAQELK
jgi:hypothetical protein